MIKNKKIIYIVIMLSILTLQGYTQEGVGEPEPDLNVIEPAQQSLREISINKFEEAAFWYGKISHDNGIITVRNKKGSSPEKETLEGGQKAVIEEVNENVIGIRVDFFRRGKVDFYVNSVKPLPIEGILKTVSIWVWSTDAEHTLSLVLKDQLGNYVELTMGELNFSGWKNMVVSIPPSIVQKENNYNDDVGIHIIGFKVKCDLEEDSAKFYIYFDDLRAVTDIMNKENTYDSLSPDA